MKQSSSQRTTRQNKMAASTKKVLRKTNKSTVSVASTTCSGSTISRKDSKRSSTNNRERSDRAKTYSILAKACNDKFRDSILEMVRSGNLNISPPKQDVKCTKKIKIKRDNCQSSDFKGVNNASKKISKPAIRKNTSKKSRLTSGRKVRSVSGRSQTQSMIGIKGRKAVHKSNTSNMSRINVNNEFKDIKGKTVK